MKKLITLFLLAALLLLPACGSKKSVVTTVGEIHAAYEGNQVSADAIYKDKWLTVTGYVDDIVSKKTSAWVYILDLDSVTSKYVVAIFDLESKDIKKVGELEVGDIVTVKGLFKGISVFGQMGAVNLYESSLLNTVSE